MIRQIIEFRKDDGEIEYFYMAQTDEDMESHDDFIKKMATETVIEYVDGDTVRGVFEGATQETLLGLLNDGWSFSEMVDEVEED